MKEKEKIFYNMALNEVLEFNIDKYHTIFLTNMVVRKILHPEEGIDKTAEKVMYLMPMYYKEKKNVLIISARKSLENLESALDESNIPQSWMKGYVVSHVVKKLVKRVLNKFD